jgi:hypothetical protein
VQLQHSDELSEVDQEIQQCMRELQRLQKISLVLDGLEAEQAQ